MRAHTAGRPASIRPLTEWHPAPGPGRRIALLRVHRRVGGPALGWLVAGPVAVPCVLGPAGFTRRKREGDGATPVGIFPLRGGFFRSDRGPRPAGLHALRATRADDGWCDDPRAPCYNRPVTLPLDASHERMWREDRLYDIGLVVDYNVSRARKGLGSAIFVHVMHPEARPTAGCVALRPQDLRRLLPRLAGRCRVAIG